MDDEEIVTVCAKCDETLITERCSCDNFFCEECFKIHVRRQPTHRKASHSSGTSKLLKAWKFVKGIGGTATFEKDEGAKWFGLVEETKFDPPVCRIVETPRLSELLELSKYADELSPKRQFPSLVSFLGDTGAGKSTLIRALIVQAAAQEDDFARIDAPIVGADGSLESTTGEVNLYYDPWTFGTASPRLYVDCEGLGGTKPKASSHQRQWSSSVLSHQIRHQRGVPIDRKWAVTKLYPKFVYIFSDVVCYVTRNTKGWPVVVDNLLRWAMVAAQHAVNQYALPAAIIVLNGTYDGQPEWVDGNPEYLTRRFFRIVENMMEDKYIQSVAEQYKVDSVEAILKRCFSTIHVIYVPLKNLAPLGTEEILFKQYGKLRERIRTDTERVSAAREERWMRFDSKQLSLACNYAFRHLASQSHRPFDFSDYRSQTTVPKTAKSHVSAFLNSVLTSNGERGVEYAAAVLGSSMVMRAIHENGQDLFKHPDAILDKKMRKMAQGAIDNYIDSGVSCAFIDNATGAQCVNTKSGHVKGHQSADGQLLAAGDFQSGVFDSDAFWAKVEAQVTEFLHSIDRFEDGEMQLVARQLHRHNLRQSEYWRPSSSPRAFGSKTCFGCLFEAPEYSLPCGHFLCGSCVSTFDESTEEESYPSFAVHNECIFCGDAENSQWPLKFAVKPPLSGVRVLSLDGGGVRGIVELVTLQRLQKAIGLAVRPCAYFDLITGTSAGGIIALGLGVHNWSIPECIDKFETFSNDGLSAKFGTKGYFGSGWLVRLLRGSIYSTKSYESAIQTAFGVSKRMFGLATSRGSTRTKPRVAVTTTVGTELKLFTNYNGGDGAEYLDSTSTSTWQVARSTSAAPMYLEPYQNFEAGGVVCRDGGLTQNNPISTAVLEAQKIWGGDVTFDTLVSVGSGETWKPADRPVSSFVVESWLTSLYNTFMDSLNGQTEWNKFYRLAPPIIKVRARRLQVHFTETQEPALDDVAKIPSMKERAATFPYHRAIEGFTYVSPTQNDAILDVALQIRASFFYYHPHKIEYNEFRNTALIHGAMYCRLDSQLIAFAQLHALTIGFTMTGPLVDMPALEQCRPKFILPFTVQHDLRAPNQEITFRARFKGGENGKGYSAPISGFPVTFQTIEKFVPKQ